jgi:hypothetical protein
MRRALLLALILAAVGVTLALALGSADTETPQSAVARFLQSRNPSDACNEWASLSSSQRWACVHSVVRGPWATHLVISHVVIHGKNATLRADFDYPSNAVGEHFSLVQHHGVWLITGQSILSR